MYLYREKWQNSSWVWKPITIHYICKQRTINVYVGLLSRKAEIEIFRKEIIFLFSEKKKAEYEAGHEEKKKWKADNKSNLTVEMFSSMWRREKWHVPKTDRSHNLYAKSVTRYYFCISVSLLEVVHTDMANTLNLSGKRMQKNNSLLVYWFS